MATTALITRPDEDAEPLAAALVARGITVLREPLLTPDGNEREGDVPNVVYSCGGLVHGRELIIPYAMSDYASSFATVNLDDLLHELTAYSVD